MGIKSLTKSIQKYSPNSITSENLYKLSGSKIAVDASLMIYQQLLKYPKGALFKNSKGNITDHIIGIFYKIMNYISLNIELIFIFDGKPPDNKKECIDKRKEKSKKAIDKIDGNSSIEEKNRIEKASIRLTKEMVDDIKKLLSFMGVSYIHPIEGEGEAYASELCRIGYVDYVLTEDMDTLVYGCPKLITNCKDKTLKRKDIISIFDYDKMITGFDISHDKFIDFCILCGCDYCPVIPRIGNVTAYKLIKEYNSIEEIISNTKYDFPSNYLQLFNDSKINFKLFRNKIDKGKVPIISCKRDIDALKNYLINDVEMNEKRVINTIKKFHNNYR